MTAYPRIVVIAWTVPGMEWDGESYASDLGARPTMVEIVEPRAVVWVLDGTATDVAKAEAHAATIEGAKVYTFNRRHTDPLVAARAMVLKESSR